MRNKVWAGVRVLILNQANELLLVKHRQIKNGEIDEYWVNPGGGVEQGEFTSDAGIREVKEETGLDIRITRLLWIVEEKKDNHVIHTNYFLGEVIGGNLCLGNDPELSDDEQILNEVRYFSKEEIKNLKRVYPERIRHEFWKLIENKEFNHQPYIKTNII